MARSEAHSFADRHQHGQTDHIRTYGHAPASRVTAKACQEIWGLRADSRLIAVGSHLPTPPVSCRTMTWTAHQPLESLHRPVYPLLRTATRFMMK